MTRSGPEILKVARPGPEVLKVARPGPEDLKVARTLPDPPGRGPAPTSEFSASNNYFMRKLS